MARIIVYNNATRALEVYYRGEQERMPYNLNNTLSVDEFRGSSKANTLWTDRTTMETWNQFRSYYGKSIPVGFAFKRPWEGGHGKQSQHYAGTSFDTGQALPSTERENLRVKANQFGKWSYVEPRSISPTWVHFDKRFGQPACSTGGYPSLSVGSRGNYVLILQDALNALGFVSGRPDGVFGNKTLAQVQAFQRARGITADGVVNCDTWTKIMNEAVGIGRTATVID